MNYQDIFNHLWDDYLLQNPETQKVYDLFINEGEEVVNDHIAFRTFDHPLVSIDVLAKPFIDAGYEKKGTYQFEAKKLKAHHFEHKEDEKAPKVFISALEVEKFSPFLQKTVTDLMKNVDLDIGKDISFLWNGSPWGTPDYSIYQKLQEESEYAAWLYVYGFRANHFTVNINHLQKHTDIYELNQFLRDHGFSILESGGEVKGSPEELLEQSSIKAGKIAVEFTDGYREIPSCFYEFAKRYPDTDGKLYSGFIAKSADKIFESTDNV
jgi:hypothetical protein